MDKGKRHILLYKILRLLVTPYMRYKMHFTCKPVKQGMAPAPYLVLANHNTNYDPLLMSMAFRPHMYFVTSEHIYRYGFASRLLRYVLCPIPITKGDTDARASVGIIRKLRQGYNVCLFPEGNRSFHGLTNPISPSTGKLVKASGASLVTYKLVGGYLTHPRWATTHRKGRMHGHVVNIYEAKAIDAMSIEEINAVIREDLYEDAYERQRTDPVRYRGKRLAEGLEVALYICPSCLRIGTMHSANDQLKCGSCNLLVTYDEYGGLSGEGLQFDTITKWDTWQTGQLKRYIEERGEDEALFSDENQALYLVTPGKVDYHITTGLLSMYQDRLVCGTAACFLLSELSGMAICARMTLCFTTKDGSHYEIRTKALRSALKYLATYHILKKQGR